jgi:hypothetical protein
MNGTSNSTRRDFLKTTASTAALAALAPGAFAATSPADRGAATPSASRSGGPMVGIQVGAVSFQDEGTESVLDRVQERGAVDTLFVAAFTYGTGIGGRQVPGQPLPDHGKPVYETEFRGGNFATPHEAFYSRTAVRPRKAPSGGDYDVLADVLPRAHRRGMKVYAWYEDQFHVDEPGVAGLREIDWQGRPANTLCPLHPDYREFVMALTADYCASYDIDGVMWGSERQGPLHNALGAKVGAGDPSRVTCFCEHHQKAARARGIDVGRAKAGFAALDKFVTGARAGQRPSDGYFVAFWRLLLEYPELLAWEKLWTDGKHAVYADVFQTAKQHRPDVQVGFHIWHVNSFSPFLRAENDYAELAKVADYLKIVVYNNCGGPRYASFIGNLADTVFHDLPKDEVLALNNALLGLGDEAPLDRLPAAGLSADYVARETKRALAGVAGTPCRIYPGLDVDVPTQPGQKRTSPEDVYESTSAALKAGAQGVLFSRKYSEMRLENLAAGGRAVRDRKAKPA